MIFASIYVTKDKHDCFIMNSESKTLFNTFTISNNKDVFDKLYQNINSCSTDLSKIKVGLETTVHYSYNISDYLLDKGLLTFVINLLNTNLYRKSLSLRKTKMDKVYVCTIAIMLMSDIDLKSYSDILYHDLAKILIAENIVFSRLFKI